MRMDGETLVLSERNLLALLSKLYTDGSSCELEGPIKVRAENDAQHYGRRSPGALHPSTERILKIIQSSAPFESL